MKHSWIGLVVISALFIFGCGPKRIPGLDIELTDTPDHRALLQVLETYKQAYENRDIDTLVGLASPRFYETAGSTDTSDDYNYDGLRKHFTEHFKIIEKCALNISLKDVSMKEDEATIDYHYVTRYLMKLPSGEKWQITDDVNRMQLVRENKQWKILSGM